MKMLKGILSAATALLLVGSGPALAQFVGGPSPAPEPSSFPFPTLPDGTIVPKASEVQGKRTPYYFKAKGDGVTDDTNAIQSWVTWMAAGNNGACSVGTFRTTAPINGYTTVGYDMDGSGIHSCLFKIDFNGWGLAAFDFSSPSSPTKNNRGSIVRWNNVKFYYNTALTAPPIAFKYRYAVIALDNIDFNQYTVNRGTVLSLSAPFNARLNNVQIWGAGGNYSSHLVNSATRFTINAASSTMTASQSEFTSADVGRQMMFYGGSSASYSEAFTISAYVDATHVTVSRPAAVDHLSMQAAFSTILGNATASSNVYPTSADRMTSADIGRTVYVPGVGSSTLGGSSRSPIRSTVTAAGTSSVTLADNAAHTLANVPLIIDPAAEIYPETDAFANDFYATDLHFEQNSGVSYVGFTGGPATYQHMKIETNLPSNPGVTDLDAEAAAAFFQQNGVYVDGEVQGPNTTRATIWTENIYGNFTLGSLQNSLLTGMPYLDTRNNATGCASTTGPISAIYQMDPTWLPSLFATDGTCPLWLTSRGPVTAAKTAVGTNGAQSFSPLVVGDLSLTSETSVASASTTDIGAVASVKVLITGTTPITSFGTVAGKFRLIRFSGVLTLTYDATALILPGAANITTAAGDFAIATSDDSGNWRIRQYTRATSAPVRAPKIIAFNASGTYTPTAGMSVADVYICGGGGGGGGGALVAPSTAASGAGGGGGAECPVERFSAAQIGTSQVITLGAAGTGGSAAVSPSNNGGNGSAGGSSTFGSLLEARCGGGGAGGQIGTAAGGGGGGGLNTCGGSATAATGGTAGTGGGAGSSSGGGGGNPTLTFTGAGGSGSNATGVGASGGFGFGGPSGGGSGGGFDASNLTHNGGTGSQNLGNGFNSGSAVGGTAGGTVAGGNGSSYTGYLYGGGGGAGGASDLTAAGAGGTGGGPGGGGGGGGDAQNGGAPGKGGDGGAPVAYVVEW